jgi:hypothetical protein
MINNSDLIKKAYINSIKAKKSLGIIDGKSPLLKISNKTKINGKPILAITSYNQQMIDNFNEEIVKKIKEMVYSVKFFGDRGNLLSNSKNTF